MPRGNDKQTILNMFYNSSKPLVLISPSLTEGIDLKDDLSRFCIICKMPYANLKDKWTRIRINEDQKWYMIKACTTLVQMTGRSIRSEQDFAKTYILDSDFLNLAKFGINTFPKWWQDAVIIDNDK
jgi:Rad3-related DNA helicase